VAGDPLKRAGILLFVGAAQFLVFLVISESVYPNYNVSSQPISDLGATCIQGSCYIPNSSAIFDSTVFVLGLLSFIGAFFIYISRSRLVGGLAAVAAWGVMGVGIFPETTGSLHVVVSFIAFFFGAVSAIVSFKMVRPPLSFLNIILGVIALVALGLYASGTYLGLGPGGMENLVTFPDVIWVLGFGSYLMAHQQDTTSIPIPL
jgi:hypothetical membrane protein